jgi:hypothetical protein
MEISRRVWNFLIVIMATPISFELGDVAVLGFPRSSSN